MSDDSPDFAETLEERLKHVNTFYQELTKLTKKSLLEFALMPEEKQDQILILLRKYITPHREQIMRKIREAVSDPAGLGE